MARFRKKPVVIEAWRFVDEEHQDLTPLWLRAALQRGDVRYSGGDAPRLTIKTLEGDMRADVGDWVIRGVKGEIYPCKSEIFEVTYEVAE